jgi:hypothetical protein
LTLVAIISISIYSELKYKRNVFSTQISIISSYKKLFEIKEVKEGEFAYMSGFKSIFALVAYCTHYITNIQLYPVRNSERLQSFHDGIFRFYVSQATTGVVQHVMLSTMLLSIFVWRSLER